MMADAGYNPIQLPQFFEKLQAKQGTAGEPRGLSLWLASHPATGSRIQYVSEDIKFYPQKNYSANTGNFARVKKIMATIPPPKMQPGKLIEPKDNPTPRANLPEGLKDYPANGFSIGYPSAWQVGQPQAGGSVYIIPQGGAVQSQSGGAELINGAMVDYYVPQAGAAATKLDVSTKEFLDSMQKSDTNMKVEKSQSVTVGGKPALRTRITTKTSVQTEPDQVVYLYSVARGEGLWYIAQASQPSKQAELEPVFKQMIDTLVFPN
jgi:Putative Zn-dependent protease, contains TPR repeats